MLRRNRKQRHAQELPDGYHDGTVASVSIRRRQQQSQGRGGSIRYTPSGWDLVDNYSGNVIAEFNDETAPPPVTRFRKRTNLGAITGHGTDPLMPDGSELGELFQSIYMLCYNTTIEIMQLAGQAIPEHKDSPDGTEIASINITARTNLPQTIKTTNKQAYDQGYYGKEPF
jgi:hypothetical protein